VHLLAAVLTGVFVADKHFMSGELAPVPRAMYLAMQADYRRNGKRDGKTAYLAQAVLQYFGSTTPNHNYSAMHITYIQRLVVLI
jgi:hypothetical protein